MDEALYKSRIITQEWPGAQHSVKKCASSFFQFATALDRDPTEANRAYERLMLELTQYEYIMTHVDAITERCDDEVKLYQRVHTEIETSIDRTTHEIEELKKQLAQEKVLRAQRQEYEEYAARLNKLRSQAELEKLRQEVEGDITAAESEAVALDRTIEARRNEFIDILGSIQCMQRSIMKEQEEKAKLAGMKAGDTDSPSADGDLTLRSRDRQVERLEEADDESQTKPSSSPVNSDTEMEAGGETGEVLEEGEA